ncbi:photosystem reaction center subunit H [Curtobacterium sp. MCBD17_034]|uniref:DUF2382 domain-containing protein n=1 Tax=unclassified Curtobacterium TaxID=257496 RepID=UPI000DA95E95|nr:MULTISPECIES: PRC and DUF2382 domain-containing protein [unclassified Curtobacterium]PZF58476.1 photosystem reaction center subunit H [Curtobacterium sp. MCBD17_034]PZM34465.1 photosystem reaction center subunit H [Curtobacterium sp. MCBD17_031]
MIDTTTMNDIFDATVIDRDGDKVGTVKQVYVDQNDGHPLFASVSTGLFGTSESFVPLENADYSNGTLTVGYDKARIKDAPRVDADGQLGIDEENTLFSYYGITGGTGTTDTYAGTDTTTTGTDTTGTVGTGTTGFEGAGHDTSGPDTDDAMTRSEQHLQVGTQQVQTGRARLRKHVVTEQQNVTVPVQHEEVRLEREPITDANVGAATDGPELSEEEHEVTLSEERVVVDKETVPVERVRLGKDTVTEQENVTEDVAHEEIELEGDGGTTGTTGTTRS